MSAFQQAVKEIDLDIHNQNYKYYSCVKDEVNSRFLEIKFIQDNIPFDLTNKSVQAYAEKPDGKVVYNNCTVENKINGIVTFALTAQMSAVVGTMNLVFEISGINPTSDLQVIGLILEVKQGVNDENIVSDSEFTVLQTAIADTKASASVAKQAADEATDAVVKTNNAIDNINQKQSDMDTDEATRQTQENTRQTNEQTRQTQETDRQSVEASRVSAETNRVQNEATRQTNEATRQTQESTRQGNETVREKNEDTRKSNETDRQSAETLRDSNENTRKTNESNRQTQETDRVNAEQNRADKESARDNAESDRITSEEGRVTAETARVASENKRQTDTATVISNANTATDNANHVPQYGDNGNWQSWNGTAYADSGKPWKGEKGDEGVPFEYGASYDTLTALQAAYPTGDTKGHLVGEVAYIWDGLAWKNTGTDLSEYIKNTRKINNHDLTTDITLTASDVSAAPSTHVTDTVSSDIGVHGLRWYQSKLQAKNGENWDDISTGGGNSGLAPADISGLVATAGNKEVTIVWSDPADSVIDGVTVSKWAGSKLVRKEGAYPTDVTDGILLVDNKIRDTYKTTGYIDTGLTNGTTYYYAVFPYSDTGAVNKDEANRISTVPTTYPLPACTGISASSGNTQITVCWSDPLDVEGKVTWAGSKLVRKQGSYPTSVTDGTLLVDNTTRDKYKTTGYIDTGLINGTTYYYMIFPYSTTGEITVNTANQVSSSPQAYTKFGVIWHYTQSSPVCERIDDSINYSATATNGATAGVSDFDGKPIYKDIKVCNVVNRAVVAYEGDAGFKRDGTNGDVMVEIPKFYYKVTDDGTNRTYEISNTALDGFNVAPRHAPCDDFPNGLNKIYVGAYEVSAAYKSISGAAPLVSETLPAFRTGFTGRGAGYHMMDWATQFEIQILYLVEFATWNSQLVVGNGNVSTTAAIATGGSDSVTGLTGCSDMSSSALAVKYRGMENLWGNVLEWRDGINFDDSTIYICINPSKYASDTATNYTKLGYTKAASNGYISALGVDTSMPWAQISTGVAGSVSTYLCDYYWQNSGWCVAFVGGHWAGGSNAGLFCLHSYNASSASGASLGSRLLVLPEE